MEGCIELARESSPKRLLPTESWALTKAARGRLLLHFLTRPPQRCLLGCSTFGEAPTSNTLIRDSIVWERISSELGGNDLTTMRCSCIGIEAMRTFYLQRKEVESSFAVIQALIQADSVTWVDLSDALPLSAQPVLAVETVLGGLELSVHRLQQSGVAFFRSR